MKEFVEAVVGLVVIALIGASVALILIGSLASVEAAINTRQLVKSQLERTAQPCDCNKVEEAKAGE